jgi:hypothetical protein
MVTATEGTNICAVVSPDGKTVAFDVYAMLWLVPIEGGPAKRLTDEIYEIAQPDWSPDGKTIAFQSYRDGNFHVWTIGATASGPEATDQGRVRLPRAALVAGRQDDRLLVRSGRALRRPPAGRRQRRDHRLQFWSGDEFEPSWSPDGKSIAFTVDKVRIDVQGLDGDAADGGQGQGFGRPLQRRLGGQPGLHAGRPGRGLHRHRERQGRAAQRRRRGDPGRGRLPVPRRRGCRPASSSTRPTARSSAGRSGGEAQGVAFTAAVPVLTPRYTKKSRDFLSAKTRPVVGIGSPALSPDGRQMAFRALNDLYLLDIGGGPAKP